MGRRYEYIGKVFRLKNFRLKPKAIKGAALAVLFAVPVRKFYRRRGYERIEYTFCPAICLLTFVIKYYGLFFD